MEPLNYGRDNSSARVASSARNKLQLIESLSHVAPWNPKYLRLLPHL